MAAKDARPEANEICLLDTRIEQIKRDWATGKMGYPSWPRRSHCGLVVGFFRFSDSVAADQGPRFWPEFMPASHPFFSTQVEVRNGGPVDES